MKKCNKVNESVSISRSELSAINNLLFNGNGVDLSSIIDDLAVGEDRDVIQMRVGFTFRGMNGFVADRGETRYEYNYNNSGFKYVVRGVSHIKHLIEVERYLIKAQLDDSDVDNMIYDENGQIVSVDGMPLSYKVVEDAGICTVTFDDWKRFAKTIDESWIK